MFYSCKWCLTELGNLGLIKDPLELMGIFPSISPGLKITFIIWKNDLSFFPAPHTSCNIIYFCFYDLKGLNH